MRVLVWSDALDAGVVNSIDFILAADGAAVAGNVRSPDGSADFRGGVSEIVMNPFGIGYFQSFTNLRKSFFMTLL